MERDPTIKKRGGSIKNREEQRKKEEEKLRAYSIAILYS